MNSDDWIERIVAKWHAVMLALQFWSDVMTAAIHSRKAVAR